MSLLHKLSIYTLAWVNHLKIWPDDAMLNYPTIICCIFLHYMYIVPTCMYTMNYGHSVTSQHAKTRSKYVAYIDDYAYESHDWLILLGSWLTNSLSFTIATTKWSCLLKIPQFTNSRWWEINTSSFLHNCCCKPLTLVTLLLFHHNHFTSYWGYRLVHEITCSNFSLDISYCRSLYYRCTLVKIEFPLPD